MADKIKIGGELDPRTPEKILGDASTIKDRTWANAHPDVAQTPNQKQDEINEYLQKQIDNIVATEQGGIQTDASPTEDSVKLVQSGGTYAAIKNAETAAKTFSTGETVPNIGITSTPTNNTDKLVTSKGVKDAIENIAFSTNEKVKNVGIDSEPTVGSDNLVTSNGVAKKYGDYIENSEFVYVMTDSEDRILWAIKNDGDIYYGAGCPQQVKDYIEEKISLLSLDEYEDIVAFLSDYLGSDTTLKIMIDDINDSIATKLDAEGLDPDALATVQVIKSIEYIQATTDSEDKILEGIKQNGTKVVNTDVELNRNVSIQGNKTLVAEHSEYIEAKIDAEGKLIEGVTVSGKKHISQFDKDTEDVIKNIAGGGSGVGSNVIEIALLDANFTSPVPVVITGTKGNENAKYEFELPLSEDAFNIRFKFKITENILNQNKNAVIAKLGNTNAVYATVTTLSQLQSSTTYNGETKIMNWPSLRGGIGLNGSSVTRTTSSVGDKQNIGNFAFYIKYIGESTNVTIENTGQAFIVKVDGVETSLPYSTYPTLSELYEAIKLLPNFEVSYNELESRICSELAIFTECSLVGKYYTGIDGTKNATKEEYYDSAPFLIPYAVSEEWHQVEIVKIGDTVYASCDGTVVSISPTDNILVLGGNCGCLFKDFSVDTISNNDAEIVNGIIISSVNPHIIIHEGHNIIKTPTCEIVDTSSNMGTTVDRLQLVYSKMISKGYVPVTLDDIADYYAGNKTLPKRCFTSIFDDYRWVNCLDLDNRAVFTRLGILPTLAIITSYSPSTIVHNGSEITIQQASTICRNYRFGLVSHTRNHRDNWNIKPSTYISEFTADVYEGDIKGIDNTIIVYPYGHAYEYLLDILKWLGFRLGVNIIGGGSNIKNRNRYNLTREDISVNSDIDDVLDGII